jgi:leader peptidase (prepilin peptidase)/N-methyltransferase
VKPVPASVKLQVHGPITLSRPRSRCPSCNHQITWYENIPVLSYLWLRGKCSSCKARIAIRYPLIELLTGALFAAIGWRFGPQPTTLLWCGFAAVLVAASAIDWDTTYLFDDLTQPLLWAGLVAAAMGWTLPLSTALWGAVAGYGSLWSIARLFEIVTRRKEAAMGSGDFKLLAALGAWLGLQMLIPVVLAASLVGAVIGIGLKFSRGLREGEYIPFGPFLAGGALLVMLAGPHQVAGWLGWTAP